MDTKRDGEAQNEARPQIAVWYFVGATFVFSSTTLFFNDPAPWLRIATLVVGFLLVIAGGFQLRSELARNRRDRGDA